MAKEDLKLRVTPNAPLTTKGSALTWVELDANWIQIYNAFKELSQSSYIAAYDAGVTYDDTINNYAMYSNQLWKCIAASPIIAITPVEGVNWTAKYATDLVGKNLDLNVKKYKALLSQDAPIAAQTSGVFIVGQIWTLTTYVAGDDFSNMELLTGTVNTSGSTFRATSTTPTTWTNSSSLDYDGSPYIVSTDANGDFNPFSNTLGGSPVFTWVSANRYLMTLAGVFPSEDKVGVKFGKGRYSTDSKLVSVDIEYFWNDANSIGIETYLYKPSDALTSVDATGGLLNYHLIEIEVYP